MSSIEPNTNIDVHSRYAIDTALEEAFRKEHRLEDLMDTRVVSDHAKILDLIPKPGAFNWLFGVNQIRIWAYFMTPQNLASNRIFFFGGPGTIEKIRADSQRIASIDCSHADPKEQAEREKERATLTHFNELLGSLSEDYEYIMGRTHHFVQA